MNLSLLLDRLPILGPRREYQRIVRRRILEEEEEEIIFYVGDPHRDGTAEVLRALSK